MTEFLDLESWHRREHFYFFRAYDNPYFNLCANVDISALKAAASARHPKVSISMALFYTSLRAANQVEPFRYRIRDQRVWVHDRIHGGSTVLRDDESFGFSYFNYQQDFGAFAAEGEAEIERVKSTRILEPRSDDDDLIHYSVIPWVSFTSFSHARRWNTDDAVPKLVFGKFFPQGDRYLLPVSVEVHHALMDGLHVGRFFEAFQALLDEPEAWLGRP